MLGDYLRVALPELRAHAESRMGAANGGSTVTIRRKTGEMAQNEVTGLEVPAWVVVHADLPARIGGFWGPGPQRQRNIGGVERSESTRVVSVPAGTAGLVDGDHVDVTAGANVGLALRIIEVDWQDQATALRLPVEAVQRPEEW